MGVLYSSMGKRTHQPKLVSVGMLPDIKAKESVIGKKINVVGSFWSGCSAADKKKVFPCTVLQYSAMHKFAVITSQAYEVVLAEAGQDTEPFWVAYPKPFLEYYHAAESPPEEASDEEQPAPKKQKKSGLSNPALLKATTFVKEEIIATGSSAGKTKTFYECAVVVGHDSDGKELLCGHPLTVIGSTSTNAYDHYRSLAEKCPAHKAVVTEAAQYNKKTTLVEGQ